MQKKEKNVDMQELVALAQTGVDLERRTHELLTIMYTLCKDARGRAYTRGNIYKQMRKYAKEGNVQQVRNCQSLLQNLPTYKIKL